MQAHLQKNDEFKAQHLIQRIKKRAIDENQSRPTKIK